MTRSVKNHPVTATREERIEELMQQLRPKVEEAVRMCPKQAISIAED